MNRESRIENREPKLIVALDVDTLKKAERLVNILYPTVNIFKVGSPLFTAEGPEAVRMIRKKEAQVFLDLKFHDIPNTVFQAVYAGTASAVTMTPTVTGSFNKDVKEDVKGATQLAVFMMTVHTEGGREMLKAAVRGAREKAAELKIKTPFIIGVTVLTSDNNESNTEQKVLDAARLAKDVGLDGVVCSAHEAARVRKECGNDFLIVTPSIRPKGYKSDDQSRVATAQEAVKAGADFIVVGRPIIKADDPKKAAENIVEEISQVTPPSKQGSKFLGA